MMFAADKTPRPPVRRGPSGWWLAPVAFIAVGVAVVTQDFLLALALFGLFLLLRRASLGGGSSRARPWAGAVLGVALVGGGVGLLLLGAGAAEEATGDGLSVGLTMMALIGGAGLLAGGLAVLAASLLARPPGKPGAGTSRPEDTGPIEAASPPRER